MFVFCAFNLFVKRCTKYLLQKHSRTCTFTGCFTIRWITEFWRFNHACLLWVQPQKDDSWVKIIFENSRPILGFTHSTRFSTCFPLTKDFYFVDRQPYSENILCSPYWTSRILAKHFYYGFIDFFRCWPLGATFR